MTHPNKDNQAERAALELLPCPMCSGKAEKHKNSRGTYHYIFCDNCILQIGPHESPEAATSAWNRRAAANSAPPALDEEGLAALPDAMAYDANSEPQYTAEQVRQAQRDAVAADRVARGQQEIQRPSEIKIPEGPTLRYEARTTGKPGWLMYHPNGELIRAMSVTEVALIEASLTSCARQDQQPARASVDDFDFSALIGRLIEEAEKTDYRSSYNDARAALIAHINAWGGVAPK